MAVAARFRITAITKTASGPVVEPVGEVHLFPDLSKGNGDWAKYTPAGEIRLNVNGPAFPWFEERLGQTVAITFDDVKEAESVSAGGEG